MNCSETANTAVRMLTGGVGVDDEELSGFLDWVEQFGDDPEPSDQESRFSPANSTAI